MAAFEKIVPGAFVVCIALTACGDRADREGYAQNAAPGAADTVTQPSNMPAPATSAPEVARDLRGRDSRETAPLASSDTKKENTSMPEALHGNNHGSPSVGTTSKPEGDSGSSPLKKSSLILPRTPKVIWI